MSNKSARADQARIDGVPPRSWAEASAVASSVEWLRSDDLVPYPEALAFMECRVEAIRNGAAAEAIWLLEHPPLYTAGTSAQEEELLDPGRFPVFHTGRGGRFTYHGPGQRVAYTMLDLRSRGADVRAFVRSLESWVIEALGLLGVDAERRDGRVGIWTTTGPEREAKIAAIGVRVRRWITYHGVAINVNPTLSHFSGIVPCGISDHGVTSLADLGRAATIGDLDRALLQTFANQLRAE